MVRIELTLPIERARGEVFAVLTDLGRLPEWQSSAVESHAEAPLAEGVHIREKRRLLGRELENELEVTAYDPPHRLTLHALRGPIRFTVDHELVDDAGSTLLHVVAQAEPGSFMKLAEPLLARTAQEELRKDFDRLKGILEAR